MRRRRGEAGDEISKDKKSLSTFSGQLEAAVDYSWKEDQYLDVVSLACLTASGQEKLSFVTHLSQALASKCYIRFILIKA